VPGDAITECQANLEPLGQGNSQSTASLHMACMQSLSQLGYCGSASVKGCAKAVLSTKMPVSGGSAPLLAATCSLRPKHMHHAVFIVCQTLAQCDSHGRLPASSTGTAGTAQACLRVPGRHCSVTRTHHTVQTALQSLCGTQAVLCNCGRAFLPQRPRDTVKAVLPQ